jgi:hypothetical protein
MAGRLAHQVRNDDKITGVTLSQTVPGKTLGKALQDIEVSPRNKVIVIFHELFRLGFDQAGLDPHQACSPINSATASQTLELRHNRNWQVRIVTAKGLRLMRDTALAGVSGGSPHGTKFAER